MPKWEIHNKWAERMGISTEISNHVNSLIDFPEKCSEYLDFCTDIIKWSDYYEERSSKWPFKERAFKDLNSLQSWLRSLRKSNPSWFLKLLQIGHDTSRSKKAQGLQAHIQLKFLHSRGTEYIKAWYMHHILDYVEKVADTFSLEEIFERLNNRIRPCHEFSTVKDFVRNHWGEILRDLGYCGMMKEI